MTIEKIGEIGADNRAKVSYNRFISLGGRSCDNQRQPSRMRAGTRLDCYLPYRVVPRVCGVSSAKMHIRGAIGGGLREVCGSPRRDG